MRISDWSSDVCSSDLIAAPELVELFMQRGAGKGVGQPLVDDQLPLARCHRRVDRAARLVEVEEAAGLALVTNVDDRRAGLAGPIEQAGTVVQPDVHAHHPPVHPHALVLAFDAPVAPDRNSPLSETGSANNL